MKAEKLSLHLKKSIIFDDNTHFLPLHPNENFINLDQIEILQNFFFPSILTNTKEKQKSKEQTSFFLFCFLNIGPLQ